MRTARIYINSGLAVLADMHISPRLTPFLTVYTNSVHSPSLEPALKAELGDVERGQRVKIVKVGREES